MKLLLLLGSRNPEGQTARAAAALAAGYTAAGGETETHLIPALRVERCRQCDDNGWGLCRSEGRCVIDDDLSEIIAKIGKADAVAFLTPVYFGDLSESMRALTDRLRRCSRRGPLAGLEGKPTVGICVAGGGGGGAPNCCVSLERVLSHCHLDVVDLIPVRRQNLDAKKAQLDLAGRWLATGPSSK